MLLRVQPGIECCRFAELEKLAQFKPEFRQSGDQLIGLMVTLRHLYIVTRYIFLSETPWQ